MLPLGSCPGFDVGGDSLRFGTGRLSVQGVEGWGKVLEWGFWTSFEWPHSQYLTSNDNGFSYWILC